MKSILDFLDCPLRNFPANHVPEAEIRCRYDSCLSGVGVAGAGVCGVNHSILVTATICAALLLLALYMGGVACWAQWGIG